MDRRATDRRVNSRGQAVAKAFVWFGGLLVGWAALGMIAHLFVWFFRLGWEFL